MNLVTVAVGIIAIVFGAYTAWARQHKPHQFKKLEPMKRFWGERAGWSIHFVGYTLVPIAVGIFLVRKGLDGGSLF